MRGVLGAIIAGGRSARFGAPKPLVMLAGERLVDRVARALRDATDHVVVIANEPALAATIGLPWRADELHDIGSLAGVHAALRWAAERGDGGILAVAVDLPLISAPLLRRLRSEGEQGRDAVLPESTGPRGMEPLCAYYAITCLPAIERAATRGDARMIGFHGEVHVHRLPLAEVRAFGEPERLFANLNSPAELAGLERMLGGEGP
ncbi:MAG: molybdenum cofactor guanylyltransferase [Gemmatimonadetes bacterium]|nr:molybdenum cofactor guanylyltransferase [Gemmatimonadota bacterium]